MRLILTYPTLRCSRLAKKFPDILEGGLNAICGQLGQQEPYSKQHSAEASSIENVPMASMCHYKALLQLDGNSASGRFPYLFWMDSVLLKQVTSKHA